MWRQIYDNIINKNLKILSIVYKELKKRGRGWYNQKKVIIEQGWKKE